MTVSLRQPLGRDPLWTAANVQHDHLISLISVQISGLPSSSDMDNGRCWLKCQAPLSTPLFHTLERTDWNLYVSSPYVVTKWATPWGEKLTWRIKCVSLDTALSTCFARIMASFMEVRSPMCHQSGGISSVCFSMMSAIWHFFMNMYNSSGWDDVMWAKAAAWTQIGHSIQTAST